MIAAGVGFRACVSAEDIAALVREALRRGGLDAGCLSVLATVAGRAAQPAFEQAARLLRVAPVSLAADALRAMDEAVEARSARILALYGVGSVAEAAALRAAGGAATLLVPRIATDRATCAIARGNGTAPATGLDREQAP